MIVKESLQGPEYVASMMMKAEGSNVACARKEGKARGEGTVPGGISPILQKKVVHSFVSGGSVHAGVLLRRKGGQPDLLYRSIGEITLIAWCRESCVVVVRVQNPIHVGMM